MLIIEQKFDIVDTEIDYYYIITKTIENINAYLSVRLFIIMAIILENISQ